MMTSYLIDLLTLHRRIENAADDTQRRELCQRFNSVCEAMKYRDEFLPNKRRRRETPEPPRARSL
jgi:hypothetical protein